MLQQVLGENAWKRLMCCELLGSRKHELGGGFEDFLFSTRIPGEMIQFDDHIFQMSWFNQQLVSM